MSSSLALALSKARENQRRRQMWLGGTAGATKQDSDLKDDALAAEKEPVPPEEEQSYADGGVVESDDSHSILRYKHSLMKRDTPKPEGGQVRDEGFSTAPIEGRPTESGDFMSEVAKLKKRFFAGRY